MKAKEINIFKEITSWLLFKRTLYYPPSDPASRNKETFLEQELVNLPSAIDPISILTKTKNR